MDGEDRGTATVYGRTTCSWCEKTIAFLDDKDVAYDCVSLERLDPDQRAAVMEEIGKRTTTSLVPVTVIGDETIVGFREAAIRAALA